MSLVTGSSRTPLPRTPRWRRELRLLRRDGVVRYVRLAWCLHRFHQSVRRMERG